MVKKTHVFLFICICAVFINSGCNDRSVQNEDVQYSSEQLQTVVNKYLKDKANILGTIVKVDIQGKESYEAATGYFDSSRTAQNNWHFLSVKEREKLYPRIMR